MMIYSVESGVNDVSREYSIVFYRRFVIELYPITMATHQHHLDSKFTKKFPLNGSPG